MKNETLTIAKTIAKMDHSRKRCSDFDEDCAEVKDPCNCWLGWKSVHPVTGEVFVVDQADGYCPLLHNPI